jgi:hypothetical protein
MKYNKATGVERSKHHLRKIVIGATASLLAVGAVALPTLAAGNTQSGPTVGNCMSDILYGNEPNMANGSPGGPAEQTPGTQAGNVLPTQSPGPFVNNPNDPDNPARGRSAGQFMQDGINVPALCRAAFSPSN